MNDVPKDIAGIAADVHAELFARGALQSIVQDAAAGYGLLLSQAERGQVLATVVQLIQDPVALPLREQVQKLEEQKTVLITAGRTTLSVLSAITSNLRDDDDEAWVTAALAEADTAAAQLSAAIAAASRTSG
jgi:hypothetical protein